MGSKIMLLQDTDKSRIFEHTNKLKESEAKVRILTFTNEAFVSSKAIIETNEPNFISFNFFLPVENSNPLGFQGSLAEFNVMIKYYDNTYKMKISLKYIFYILDGNKFSRQKADWGNFRESLISHYISIDKVLEKYMNGENDF